MVRQIIGIYKIISPTGSTYIGQSRDINKRIKQYIKLNCRNQRRLYNSLLKYGWENHIFEILCECSIEELNDKEIYYINQYNSFNSEKGLNLRSGGKNKISVSDETKIKASISAKNRNYIYTEKSRLKRRLAQLGKKDSLETRNKKRISRNNRDTKNCRSRKILQCSKDGSVIKLWNNISEASKETNTCMPHIHRVISGDTNTANGFIWKAV